MHCASAFVPRPIQPNHGKSHPHSDALCDDNVCRLAQFARLEHTLSPTRRAAPSRPYRRVFNLAEEGSVLAANDASEVRPMAGLHAHAARLEPQGGDHAARPELT